VTSPEGFAAGAAACGLKPSGALDVGLLRGPDRGFSALVDTTNALPSAPVLHTRSLDTSGLRGVVVNAGNANAATGSPGLEDARVMGAHAAGLLGLEAGQVAVSSTGTVGERLDLERVRRGIADARRALRPEGGPDFARAICTTDREPKAGAFRLTLPGGDAITIGAAAKGAGMISPRMATMLAYVTTDAELAPPDLAGATLSAARASFNRISVDGQMSPSDTLLVLAVGREASAGPLVGEDREAFAAGLAAVCRWLAIQMVKDGEGAEHVMRVVVREAADAEEAETVARAVGDSPLVKTAAFGRDPNWGRISQAVGAALAGRGGAPAELRVAFDGVPGGDPAVADVLARPEYDLEVSLGRGAGEATLWASDLTHAYVTLNAEYHT
jgi:glutamate N-acetyltransferase / amino-acid N-acetyltransferase